MKMTPLLACGALLLAACAPDEGQHRQVPPGDAILALATTPRAWLHTPQGLVSPQGTPFRAAGLQWEAPTAHPLEARALLLDGRWSPWSPVQVTWSEGEQHNGSWSSPSPAVALEVQSQEARQPGFLHIELYGVPLRPALEAGGSAQGLPTRSQGLAPADLVHSRQEWGARATAGCGSPHSPRYLTVHHTATPNQDSQDVPSRLRGIQSFHIDQRGWCDIGYHFLISQDGQIWQGRADEQRTGAHVGGHNTDNVGLGHLGNFEEIEPPAPLLQASARMMAWMSQTYGVELDREHVRGHREWPDNNTACPGQHLFSRLEDLLQDAAAPQGLALEASWAEATDSIKDGASQEVPDLWEGQRAQLQILVTHQGEEPWGSDSGLGISFLAPAPWLQITGWRLEQRQAEGWAPLQAQSADLDPDAITNRGTVNAGPLAPGAALRLTLEVEALSYSFGLAPFDGLQAWISEGSPQLPPADGFGAATFQAQAPLHVWSPTRWEFSGSTLEDTEGWASCNGDLARVALNTRDKALALEVSGPQSCVTSPHGAPALDAAQIARAQLRVRHYGGATRSSHLLWRGPEQDFSPERSLSFDTPGDGQWHEVTLELSQAPGWSGAITQLRLDPYRGEPGENAWFDLDHLRLLQVRVTDADQDGSPEGLDCDDQDPDRAPGRPEGCDGIDNDCDDLVDEGQVCEEPAPDPEQEPAPGPPPGLDNPQQEDGDPEPTPAELASAPSLVSPGTRVQAVCQVPALAPQAPRAALALLAGLGLLVVWGRRKRRQTPKHEE